MVYILPKNPHRPRLTYNQAYEDILRSRRLAPGSQVILIVPPELDALCAANILETLFVRDDVPYRVIPVAGFHSLQHERDGLLKTAHVSSSSSVCLPECSRTVLQEIHTIIMLNVGSLLNIADQEWFGEFPARVTIHVIDSARPVELRNLFAELEPSGEGDEESIGPRVVFWDDGHADKLTEERVAFDAGEVRASRSLHMLTC